MLGDKANMVYVCGTVDQHRCAACSTSVARFEVGDELLREHKYQVYNDGNVCAYLERALGDAERRGIVAKERYRKGFVSHADKILQCDNGKCGDECMMCAAALTTAEHGVMCASMRESLKSVLRRLKLA